MAVKLKVTYLDGREVTAVASPRAQVMAEQYLKGIGDANRVQATYYLAWASLSRSGQEPADFESWLDAISDVDELGSEPVDPTREAASSDTSSP